MNYCIDIDGTICTNTDGEYESAKPYADVIRQVNSLYDAGHRIVFFTARGSTTGIDWREVTERQLSSWEVKYHELILGKPHADIYIDDKAVNPWQYGDNPNFTTLRPSSRKESLAHGAAHSESYLSVTYAASRAPKSDYPEHLAKWLYDQFFKRSGRLLDVGCGLGDYLRAFHRLGCDVAGVDVSPRASEYAAPHEVCVADFENQALPYPHESFDFIFSKSVIEHLKNPMNVMTNSYRMLRQGGVAIFMTPSWADNYWGPFYIDHTHVTPFTKPSLEDALQLAGFSHNQVFHFHQLPFLWKYPFLSPFIQLFAKLPLPYRPMYEAPWPEAVNKFIRFAREVMLVGVAWK